MMKQKPNIILILADDMGFSDLGCYGSEIKTPNLDKLAESGLKFSQMYNSARCCPSRAALLTGLNPQQTGVGHMVTPSSIPGYEGYLNRDCATIAEVLKNSGYKTLMSGKWHVGGAYNLLSPNSWNAGDEKHPIPTQRGFDEFFGIVAGGGNYFNTKTLMRNDKFIDIDTPDFYLTDAITDNAISMINDSVGQPFFMHIAYTAPHWPLHALEEDIAKYEGTYGDGWDELRKNRHEELKALKILNSKWDISPKEESAISWSDAPDKAWEDLRMAVYAAMIDRMDQGIGRIIAKLKELSVDKETVIMFLSDNGGCAEFLAEDTLYPTPSQYSSPTRNGSAMKVGNHRDTRPGPENTFMSYDLPWANASNSPFRLFKRWTHEGGISTPFIINWPEGIKSSSIVHDPTHIIDISATLYEIAGAGYPTELNGQPITPIEGRSFYKALSENSWKREQPIFWEHEGNKAMRDGDWKIVSEIGKGWELYNMSKDRTELENLADSERNRLRDMVKSYESWANRCGVLPWPVLSNIWDPNMKATHSHISGGP